MPLKTYIMLSLVLLLAVGMGCGAGSSPTTTGTGGDSSLYGQWTLVSSTGGAYPLRVTFNSNGTGSYTGNGFNTSFNWSQSGSTVTITTGATTAATINNWATGSNTFTLNGVNGSGVYNRG